MAKAWHGNTNGIAGSYQDALRILAGRRRPTRPATASISDSKMSSDNMVTPDLRGVPSISGMRGWLQALGHSDADLRALNVIHVAGTKGKGSTCAFTESFLRSHGIRTGFPRKTGLYTSPHLVLPQERIRINFEPLSEERFAKYFFEVYHGLEQQSKDTLDFSKSPRYLQLWALVAFHAFVREKVDVAIIETHHGGEYDATNFLQDPVVAVVTTLGMDHVEQLGPELSNIAWHKAGIFKKGAAAISAPQAAEATEVLKSRASEKQLSLEIADSKTTVASIAALPSEVLRMNCNVAQSAANAWLRRVTSGHSLSLDDIVQGVDGFSWPGRFQRLADGQNEWFLDAAHNELSMAVAAQWFAEALPQGLSSSRNVLIFSHLSSHRDGAGVLRTLLSQLEQHAVPFAGVIFSTYTRQADQDDPLPDAQGDRSVSDLWEVYSRVWTEHFPGTFIHYASTIDDAVALARSLASDGNITNVLATGSQHLLGGILSILQLKYSESATT